MIILSDHCFREIISACSGEGQVDQLAGEIINHRLRSMFVRTAHCKKGEKKITFKQRVCFKCLIAEIQRGIFNPNHPSWTGESDDEYKSLVREMAAVMQVAVYGQRVVDRDIIPYFIDSEDNRVPIIIFDCGGDFICCKLLFHFNTFLLLYCLTDFEKEMNFLHLADRLKKEMRHCWNTDGRRESVAEHSWRLPLMVFRYADRLDQPVNISKCLKMALIHD